MITCFFSGFIKRMCSLICVTLFFTADAFCDLPKVISISPGTNASSNLMRPAKNNFHSRQVLNYTRHAIRRGRIDSYADLRIRESFSRIGFPKKVWGMAMAIYQPGKNRILIVRKGGHPVDIYLKLIERAIKHKRMHQFDIKNLKLCRIQVDFIVDPPTKVNMKDFSWNRLTEKRFEFGITGLRMKHEGKVKYFLPGDAYTKSVLGMGQLWRMLQKVIGSEDMSKVEFQEFESISFVSYGNEFIRLYRGHPVQGPLSKEMMQSAVRNGINNLVRNQEPTGAFDYYYDAADDSRVDHEHPKRNLKTNRYYNMVRHSGAALSLVMYYMRHKDKEVILAAQRAANYLIQHFVSYTTESNKSAAYVYSNRKAKLGASGLALFFLTEYQRVTKDDRYEMQSRQLLNHILSQITDSGEFIYYYLYLDKRITSPEDNARRFSFYYPGEAICAMVNYYLYIADESEKAMIRPKLEKALRYLFEVRPIERKKFYLSLPSDSWLMMGVKRLWDAKELRNPMYVEKVFEDADRMCEMTYTKYDALYPDYMGAYYYEYGNFPYSDGARSEGLMAALELAIKTGNKEKTAYYGDILKKAAWAEHFLVNTEASVYFAPNPETAIGGIRFKHTRQWFRIDTIAHVVCFYMRFLDVIKD